MALKARALAQAAGGDEQLLTVAQFAAEMGMSMGWARKKLAERGVAHVRIGRAVRIPRSEQRRVIEAGLVPAAPERLR